MYQVYMTSFLYSFGRITLLKMKLTVKVMVNPTENIDKVRAAVENIFDIPLVLEGYHLEGTGDNLDKLHELLRRFKVLDSARKILLRNVKGDTTHFELHKQAAYMGKVNLSSTSPLGSIEVVVEDDDIERVIDWLAPVTEGGREIA